MKFFSPLYIFIGFCFLFFSSCKNDLKVNAPYKEIPTIYSVLNPQEVIQMIRINKVFLGEGNSNTMAKVADSINYQAGDLTVTLERTMYGSQVAATPTGNKQIITFHDSVIQTNPGTFNTTQRVYVTSDRLFVTGQYTLKVKNNKTNNVFTAKANALDSIKPSMITPFTPPYYPVPAGSDPSNPDIYPDYSNQNILYSPKFFPNEGAIYTMTLRFHFYDSLNSNPDPNISKAFRYVDYNFGNKYIKDLKTYGSQKLFAFDFKGLDLFSTLGNSLSRMGLDIPEEEKERLARLFYKFPTVALLQSGQNTSGAFSMIRLIPYHAYTALMEEKAVGAKPDHITLNWIQDRLMNVKYSEAMRGVELIRPNGYDPNTVAEGADPEITKDGRIVLNPHSRLPIMPTDKDYHEYSMDYMRPTGSEEDIHNERDNLKDLKTIVESNPDFLFVTNTFNGKGVITPHTAEGTSLKDYLFRKAGIDTGNLMGIRTMEKTTQKYLDDSTLADNKRMIDEDLDNIQAEAKGKTLILNDKGYGQTMITPDRDGRLPGAETFKYLSEQLLKRFEYVNPGITTLESNIKVPSRTVRTEVKGELKQATEEQKQLITNRMKDVINPSAKQHLEKEKFKTSKATQFIGSGAFKSSTDNYAKLYKEYKLANTGNYDSSDLIYVSSNGTRTGRVDPVINGDLQGVYKNINKAIDAGASFIMDTKAHLEKTKNYNIGEIALAKHLDSKGYIRDDQTGIWKPEKPVENIDEKSSLEIKPIETKSVKDILYSKIDDDDVRKLMDAVDKQPCKF